MNPKEQEQKRTRRPRGSGSIYRQYGRGSYIAKWPDPLTGKTFVKALKTDDRKTAERMLLKLVGASLNRVATDPAIERIKVDSLIADLIADYKRAGKQNCVATTAARWKMHLGKIFSGMRASSITSRHVTEYVSRRREQGARPATINRELSCLRRCFTLARRATPPRMLNNIHISMLPEKNTRTGFLTDESFRRLAAETAKAGVWLRAMLQVGFDFGWRASEVRTLKVSAVDFALNVIRLEPNTTKNSDGRQTAMTKAIRTLLEFCAAGKRPSDLLFTGKTRTSGPDREVPIADFRLAWQKACIAAGVGVATCRKCRSELPESRVCPVCKITIPRKSVGYRGLLFHDLRRSAARNLRNRGIAMETIMRVGGWRTTQVFLRYSIVSPSDVADAMQKLEAGREPSPAMPEVAAVQDKLFSGRDKLSRGQKPTAEQLPAELPN
jgi:integrase